MEMEMQAISNIMEMVCYSVQVGICEGVCYPSNSLEYFSH